MKSEALVNFPGTEWTVVALILFIIAFIYLVITNSLLVKNNPYIAELPLRDEAPDEPRQS